MFLVIILFLGIMMVGAYICSSKRAAEEIDKVVENSIRCGGSFGWHFYCTPFVRHSIYEDFISISYGTNKICLQVNQINYVSMPWCLAGQQIRYHHENPMLPKKVIIRSSNLSTVIDLLRKKGVN